MRKSITIAKTDEVAIRKNCIAITGCEVANARQVAVIKQKMKSQIQNVNGVRCKVANSNISSLRQQQASIVIDWSCNAKI